MEKSQNICPHCGNWIGQIVQSGDTEAGLMPPRPRVRKWLAGILFYCAVFPGVIYIAVTWKRQYEWDQDYRCKKV